jgi:hypothetical protein
MAGSMFLVIYPDIEFGSVYALRGGLPPHRRECYSRYIDLEDQRQG